MVERRPVSTTTYTAPGATRAYENDLVLRAARGERTSRTPVWLMRQAGRTDPEYLRLREESGLPLQDLFSHPEWASRISLLPRRIGAVLRAAITDISAAAPVQGWHRGADEVDRASVEPRE